ncbi:hypothetical protein LguiB_033597 [Lonicera macranthoides]
MSLTFTFVGPFPLLYIYRPRLQLRLCPLCGIVEKQAIAKQQANTALSLLEGATFSSQSQDMLAIVNEVYDILKAIRMGDYEASRPKRRIKRLHDPSSTPSALVQAKALLKKKSKKWLFYILLV